MAKEIKSLAKDTVIYGIGSVFPRLLTWFLGLYWAFAFANVDGIDAPTNVGVIGLLFSYTAILNVLLTYGMETGFFRFANKSDQPMRVFSTSFISVVTTTFIFFVLMMFLLDPIAHFLSGGRGEIRTIYLILLVLIICFDVLSALPLASLRFKKRPIRFTIIRIINVSLTIALNLFFFLVCPMLKTRFPDAFSWFDLQYGIMYVFIANLAGSVVQFLLLTPELKIKFSFDKQLLMTILRYSLPMTILGIAGILNHTIDRMIFPFIYPNGETAFRELGFYHQNYKIAIIMVMFATAFRLAFDPYIFARNKGKTDDKQSFSDATNYFIIFGLFIFLVTTGFLDVIKFLIQEEFRVGLKIVPIVLLGELFFGVYFNLSLWYKLTDKTRWGAYMSLFGLAINVTIIVLFVPHFSFMAMAWAGFIANFVMMTLSYFLGQKHYPIPYQVKRAGYFFLLAMICFVGFQLTNVFVENMLLRLIFNSILILGYLVLVVKKQFMGKKLPMMGCFLGRKTTSH